jgi:pilus assembly protein Flp/PilA
MNLVKRFLLDEAGVTVIEYALIAGIIAVAIIVWATNIGGTLNTTFASMAGLLAS